MTRVWLIANAPSIICALGAVVTICMGFEHGWGWLLVVAVLTSKSGSTPT